MVSLGKEHGLMRRQQQQQQQQQHMGGAPLQYRAPEKKIEPCYGLREKLHFWAEACLTDGKELWTCTWYPMYFGSEVDYTRFFVRVLLVQCGYTQKKKSVFLLTGLFNHCIPWDCSTIVHRVEPILYLVRYLLSEVWSFSFRFRLKLTSLRRKCCCPRRTTRVSNAGTYIPDIK